MASDSPNSPLTSVLGAYRFLSPYRQVDRGFFAALILGAAALAASNTLLISLIGQPIDLLARGQFAQLTPVLGWIVGVVALNQVLSYFTTLGSNWLGLRFVGRVRVALLAHLVDLSVPVAGQYARGDVLTRLSADVDKTQNLAVELPFFMLSHLLTLLFYVAVLLWIDWRLALLAIAVIPLLVLHQRFFSNRKRMAAAGFLQKHAALTAREDEVLANLRDINVLNAQASVRRTHASAFAHAFEWALKERWLDAAFTASFAMLIYSGGLIIVYVGIQSIQTGAISIGQLVSFLLYLGYLSVPVRGLAQMPFLAQANVAATARISELFARQAVVLEKAEAIPLSVAKGRIDLDGVCFGYAPGVPVFENLSLHIAAGSTVALVGPSGAGKTTFAKLLLRFYDPERGKVSIDGSDLRTVTLNSLRQAVAVVWQNPLLFSDSIKNNLLLAKPTASDAELAAACQASFAAEFIAELPQGVDTVLGSNGIQLSSGQQQRISIAQAFLRDAPILVLDEASSALDSHSEQQVLLALERLRSGRTTLIIAHRYSSIRNADNVVYFNGDGSISVGSHDRLVANHAAYRDAVQWQFGVK